MPASFLSCWFLAGPTAAGKSAVGVELAIRLQAEIVSMDSMALYKGMDIGTAKPTAEERKAVPHHLIDVIEPWEEFSLAQYIAAAEKCASEIAGRGKPVLFVGGTPLYLKGLLRGIFEGPAADEDFRRNLSAEAKRHEPLWLHERLNKVDPAAAARLHPNDQRRLIRALEVFHLTGRPISEWQQQFDAGRAAEECKVFVLDWPREELHARIDRRVEQMFARGLVEEVRRLVGQVGNLSSLRQVGNLSYMSKTARQGVGYREAIEYLEGRHTLAETVELVKMHTRRLAKRQCTWFRSLSECRFIPLAGKIDLSEITDKISKN
ncbi:MAG: tRNA (adenosine(37)-N6)-dimethylallyltransferase MiaA [Pirellulales bacterium]|nr:tRNA (adenosine(37)-N6)-dimethylallyltransferase MiaA [Pirellulales bacterium]